MKNTVAQVLLWLGIAEIIIGFFVGVILGNDYGIDWLVLMTWTGIGATSGIVTIGFSQVIELLHQINLKLGSGESKVDEKAGIEKFVDWMLFDKNETTKEEKEEEPLFESFTDENGVRYDFHDKDNKK